MWNKDKNFNLEIKPCANRVKCGVMEWGKRNLLRWFGHVKKEKSEEFMKKVYVSET